MKQIKDMTTAEWRKAWTEIAVAFETEPKNRTEWQRKLTTTGLCVAFRNQFEKGISSWEQTPVWNLEVCEMLDNLHKADGEWFPIPLDIAWMRKYDISRSTFAAMFAAMTPKEFLEICEAPR